MKNSIVQNGENELFLTLSREVYSLEAILGAAQKYTNMCGLFIQPSQDGMFHIHFASKKGSVSSELKCIAHDFCNELLEQQLRADLEKRFGNMRDLIVRQAFLPVSDLKSVVSL